MLTVTHVHHRTVLRRRAMHEAALHGLAGNLERRFIL